MKKKIFLFAVAVGLLTACDPIKDEASMDIDNITAEQLMEGATFSQYNQVKDCVSTTCAAGRVSTEVKAAKLLRLLIVRLEAV